MSDPNYAIICSENFEDYWRKSKLLEYVAQSREKCRNFTFGINLSGTTEWLIKKWAANWCPKDMPERPDLANRILAARYMQKRGLFYTLSLLDRDKITCTIGCLIHGNDAVFQYILRDKDYRDRGAVPRKVELGCYWAKEKGLNKIDVGGPTGFFKKTRTGDKALWAPEDGKKWEFDVCPIPNLFVKRQAMQLLHKVRRKFGFHK